MKQYILFVLLFSSGVLMAQNRNFRLVNAPTKKPTGQQRKAVVIGMSDYGDGRSLNNTLNDATDMSASLTALGFEVTLLKNNDLRTLKTNLSNWYKSIEGNDMAIFYFAGHGMEVSGENFLIPVDADMSSESDVAYSALNVNQVLANMDERKIGMKLLILDACRDNPFKRSWTRSGGTKGLAQLNAPRGTFIAFAASPGFTAADGGNYNLKNGVFTHFLKQEIVKKGMSIDDVFTNVTNQVADLTGDQQTPFRNSSLRQTFYFIPAAKDPVEDDKPRPEDPVKTYYYYIGHDGNESQGRFSSRREAEAEMKLKKLYGKVYSNTGEVFVVDAPVTPPQPGTVLGDTRTVKQKLTDAENYYDNDVYDKAFAIYSSLNEKDMDVTAFYSLGYMYKNAQGVAQNYAQAMRWYRKAVDAGSTAAMANIGRLYENGQGVTKDYSEAFAWYKKAADKGYKGAMDDVGTMYRKGMGTTQDYAEAIKWYTKAVDAGDVTAMSNLGYMYDNALGVVQDHTQAANWYQKAADKGETAAMNNLGSLYSNGTGVPQNYSKAMEWYQKAAALGHVSAMYNLGIMYEFGQSVPIDYVQAKKWYQKSADAGDTDAKQRLANWKH